MENNEKKDENFVENKSNIIEKIDDKNSSNLQKLKNIDAEQELFKASDKETLEKAQGEIQKRKTKKSKIWGLIFLLINIAVLVVVLVLQSDTSEGLSFEALFKLMGQNWWCLLLAVGAWALYMILEAFRYWLLIRKTTGHNRPFLSYKVACVGQYYDNITPLAVGGQPFQIYYFMKSGVKGSSSSVIILAKSMFSQIAIAVVAFCVLIFSRVIAGGLPTATYIAAVIGACFQLIMGIIILLLSTTKNLGKFLVGGFFKLCAKLHIVKNPDEKSEKVMKMVFEYQLAMRYLLKSFPTFLLTAIDSFLLICMRAAIPFCICCAFKGFDLQLYGTVFILSVLIDMIMSYIPWPGAAGIAEVSFYTLFSHELIGLVGSEVTYAMLIWRILTYYSMLLQGLLLMLYDFWWGNKRMEKAKKKFARIDAIKAFQNQAVDESAKI